MTNCPECGAEIEPDALDEFDADIGDRLVCTVCSAALEVVKVAPVELAVEAEAPEDDPEDDDAGSWDQDDLADPGDDDE